jgi:O-antigen/teichoic acid export membrane protein
MNLEELTPSPNRHTWFFMRYRFRPDGALELALVREEPLAKLEDEAALEAIKKRVGDDALVIMPFSQVALPTLGRLQDDLPAFRKAYLRIISVSSALAFPAIIGFAVLAPVAIPLIFGPQWEESAGIARVLGCMAVPFVVNRFAGPALATLGRSGLLAQIAGLQLALSVVMTLAAAPYGLLAIAAAYVARAYLVLPMQMWAFKKHSGLGYGELLRSLAPPLLTSIAMAAALLVLDRFVGARFDSRAVYLLAMISAGCAIYTGGMLLFARPFVAQQVRDFRRLLPGASARLSRAGA